MKPNQIEKMARAYVEKCGDVAAAMRVVNVDSAGKGDKALTNLFDKVYGKSPTFWRRVVEMQKLVDQQVAMKAADVMLMWSRIATADVTELTQVVETRCACFKCWGGERMGSPPNEDCDACLGAGLPQFDVHITPTAKLTPTARMMYDGAELTKNGIKVKHLDRNKALDNLGRALGLFTDQLKILGVAQPDLPPLPDDPVAAAHVYHNWIKGA